MVKDLSGNKKGSYKLGDSIFMQLLKNTLKRILPKHAIQWLNRRRENVRYRSWRILWSIREQAMPQKYRRDPYETSEIYWVNPEKIRYRTLKEFNYLRDHNRVVGGNWDMPLSLFEENDFFQAFSQRVKENRLWSDTSYYKRYLSEILAGKVRWGCKNKEEWDQRFSMLDSIYHDIKTNGYHPQKIEDYISVNIGRSGQLLFNDGRHRLTFCKLLEVPKIPVRITVRHSKWVMFKNEIFDYTKSRKGKVYAPLTHIDLQSVSSGYGHKRFELIQKNITARDKGTLLDIGSHWGYFCHKFEEEGFHCYAVEKDFHNYYFLNKLKIAENRGFTTAHADITEIFEKSHYDVVLALNVLHQFTKTAKSYGKLVKFLRRLKTIVMFFTPHQLSEAQMQGAYRNYSTQNFVTFLADNTGLTKYECIGYGNEGRPIYKLTGTDLSK